MRISEAHRSFSLVRHRASWKAAAFCVLVFSVSSPAVAQEKLPAARDFDEIATQADQARDANHLEKALRLYHKALAMRTAWAEGWWSLGTILYDRDNYLEAARAFERVVALDPRHGSARVMLGLCEFELGQDDRALRDIEKGKELGVLKNPELHRVMLYHQGVLLLRKGKFERAQQSLDSLSHEAVDDGEVILALGMSVLGVRPKDLPPEGSTAREIVLRAGKAEWLAASKKFEEARQEYSSLATEHAGEANIHYAYGRFLLEIQEIDRAVVEFQHEIQNDPQHVLARLEIAAVRYRLDSADGVKYAEQAVKLDPQRPFGHYLLGLLYLDTSNFTGAISELETAKRNYPSVPDVYFALGNAYARAGRKAEAARARAVFTRLNSQKRKEPADTTYGEQPSGLTPRLPGPEAIPKPPQ